MSQDYQLIHDKLTLLTFINHENAQTILIVPVGSIVNSFYCAYGLQHNPGAMKALERSSTKWRVYESATYTRLMEYYGLVCLACGRPLRNHCGDPYMRSEAYDGYHMR